MECYIQDKTHLTPEGYRRMASVLQSLLEKELEAASVSKSTATGGATAVPHGV